ncbi:unnamed protein product [Clonostachys rhizophaga]|uniref:Uncharacterized protein n=1 Tax=Clonostachys rhizophaga TaxID=160324 RepID=A0A9N9VI60_9HYPO|nr:unnamed protein product [Clonostachys rhizophaga]
MAEPVSFLSLPREVRNIIYDLVPVDIPHSNILIAKTAYTSSVLPLLYVHPIISNDLQSRLYENHVIVLPVQEPSEYSTSHSRLLPHLETCSKLMKTRSNRLIVEVSQTQSHYSKDGESCHDWWYLKKDAAAFAKTLIADISLLKSHLPNVDSIDVRFWCSEMAPINDHWARNLKKLRDQWSNLVLSVRLYVFGGYDQYNRNTESTPLPDRIRAWNDWSTEATVLLEVIDCKQEDFRQGVRTGRFIDLEEWPLWKHEEYYWANDEERDEMLHSGSTDAVPIYVSLCLDR